MINPSIQRRSLLRALAVASRKGIRPRDWDADLLDALLATRNGRPEDARANYLGYCHALDAGRIEEAGRLLALAAAWHDDQPAGFRSALLWEAAFFEARHQHNLSRALAWLKKAGDEPVAELTRLRAEAAILFADGRFAEAAARSEAALAAASQSPDPGGAIAESEWLHALLDECRQQIPTESSSNRPPFRWPHPHVPAETRSPRNRSFRATSRVTRQSRSQRPTRRPELELGPIVRSLLALLHGAAIVPYALLVLGLTFWLPKVVVSSVCTEVSWGAILFHLFLAVAVFTLFPLTVVLIHELGHALAARAVDFRTQYVCVGPLKVIRQGKTFRVCYSGCEARSFDAGAVHALPKNGHDLRRRLAIFILGGPAMNLLATGPFLLLGWFFWDGWAASCWQGGELVLLAGAAANLLVGLISLIPRELKKPIFGNVHLTDGAQLLSLLWGKGRCERRFLQAALYAALLEGVRPRDWDASLVQSLSPQGDGSPEDVMIGYYAYCHALDIGRLEEAGRLIQWVASQLERHALQLDPGVALEVAFFEGFHRRNPTIAREWLNRAEGGQPGTLTRLRAEAGVLFAEGRYLTAAERAEAALAAAPHSPDKGGALAESDWVRALLDECRLKLVCQQAASANPG